MPETASIAETETEAVTPTNERPDDQSGVHASDYERPNLEPATDEERMHRKNPLGYSITEPTEEEIEAGGGAP